MSRSWAIGDRKGCNDRTGYRKYEQRGSAHTSQNSMMKLWRKKFVFSTADSVNRCTAPELFAQADIDGGLVGGASLKADFGKIANYNK